MRSDGYWWLALAGVVVIVLCAARYGGGNVSSDEALWLEQGLALDLPHSDHDVRAALVSAAQRVAMRGQPLVAPSEAPAEVSAPLSRSRCRGANTC